MKPRTLPLLAALLAGCTAEVRESDLLRPVRGAGLTGAAVAAAAPAYTLSEHRIATPDETSLYAVHLRQPGARATILYFGGNGYTVGRFGPWTASLFAPLGVDLILVDHRGYGLSEGRASAAAMEEDSLAAFDHARRIAGAGGRIVVHGHSLGSFMAGHVAANRAAAGVVLESSATTTEDWVEAGTPGAAKLFIRKVEIDPNLRGRGNLAVMSRIDEPLLLLVGAKDGTTPPSLSRSLYAASPLPQGRKILQVVAGAGHSDVMTRPGAIAAYRAFLQRLDQVVLRRRPEPGMHRRKAGSRPSPGSAASPAVQAPTAAVQLGGTNRARSPDEACAVRRNGSRHPPVHPFEPREFPHA